MPPLRKNNSKMSNTCRVCASENPVLLELFGSECQPVSYAEDVNKCLSIEVKKGDGLPSKICIKCAGVIGDFSPFFDKTTAAASERSSQCDSTSGSSCYYCLASSNILFPVPESSIIKTKDCFGIEVSTKDQICVRCQFLLEGLHDLKLQASAALKQFGVQGSSSNEVIVKKEFSPVKVKEESVEDIVDSLKDKFKLEKLKPEKKVNILDSMKEKFVIESLKPEQNMDLKLVSVQLLDISIVLGKEFLKGTVSVSKALEQLHGTHPQINGHTPSSFKTPKDLSSKKANDSSSKEKVHPSPRMTARIKQPTPRKSLKSQSEKKSRRFSKADDQAEADTVDLKADNVAVEGNKRCRESSESESEILPTKKRRRSESDRSESEKSLADSTQGKLEKDPQTSEKKGHSSEREDDQHSQESLSESPVEKKKVSKKQRVSKKDLESSQPSIIRPTVDTSTTENGVDSSDSIKPRRKCKKVEFATDFDEDDEDEEEELKIGGKRKRQLSEDDESFSPKVKGKTRKKLRQSSNSEDEKDLDESAKREKIILDQPDFLRELDDLLKFTPKATFKPFICSVCHEGYISTVKGKLHKLVVHDPHANLILKLTRCDDNKNAIENCNTGFNDCKLNPKIKIKSEVEPDVKYDTNTGVNGTETSETTKCEETDDLFSDRAPAPATVKNSEDLFNSLFDGTKTQGNDEKDSTDAEKDDGSSKSSKNDGLVESDLLNEAVSSQAKEAEIENEKVVEEGKSEGGKDEDNADPVKKPETDSGEDTPNPEQNSDSSPVMERSSKEEKLEQANDSEKQESGNDEFISDSKSDSANADTEKASSEVEEKRSEEGVHIEKPEMRSEKDEAMPEKNSETADVSSDEVQKSEETADVSSNEIQKSEETADVSSDEVQKSEETADVSSDEVQKSKETADVSSDEVQKSEGTKSVSESTVEDIRVPEIGESLTGESPEALQKPNEIVLKENEEAVSSSGVEDELPRPASAEERLEGHGSKESEADVPSNSNHCPDSVENDDVSGNVGEKNNKDVVNAVDSTTATVEPDTSAIEGIIVGDD